MEKSAADRIITEYVPKLYGFALSKTGDSRAAEELASDITYEVYLSLLKAQEVYNVNSYIWRISSYAYARYVDRHARQRMQNGASIEDIEAQLHAVGGRLPEALVDYDDPATLRREADERAAHEKELRRLRREIAYLGETQRRIIVAHYYGGKTVREIAASLSLPEGTVKWHLYDARKTIKEGMKMERNTGKLGVEPIRLASLGHSGYSGSTGDTATHLASRLAQNVAYAAYDEPKTDAEIAEELGVSPIYLAEIIEDLENYRFMTRLPDGRLRTDIVIHRSSKENDEAKHRLRKEYTQKIGELFMPQMMANMDAYLDTHRARIYLPDDDRSLWRWSAFMLGWQGNENRFLDEVSPETVEKMNRFRYKRPDGGDYTAMAWLDQDYTVDYDPSPYWACGFMTRQAPRYESVSSLQLSTNYDSRPDGWADNHNEDYALLYECYTGKLPETDANVERYRRLCNRGLIVRREGSVSVNVPVIRTDAELVPFDLFEGVDMEAFKALIREYHTRLGEQTASLYPAHIQDYFAAQNTGYDYGFMMYLYEWMLENGHLTLPEDDRRGGLMTVVLADRLPQT